MIDQGQGAGAVKEDVVVIRPRAGVTAAEVYEWLDLNFRRPDARDDGPRVVQPMEIIGGNPLVNSNINLEERS